MSNSNYGRNRQSIADIEDELYEIFEAHEACRDNEEGHPTIPATALVDVFRAYGDNHNGVQLLSRDEEASLSELVKNTPSLEVTPQVLVQFITLLTSQSAENALRGEGSIAEDRGRSSEREDGLNHSSRPSSRGPPPALPPKTPLSARIPDSPFDSNRRQRTAPLQHNAPSSWNNKKPVPGSRRRSDASNYGRTFSDSESNPPHASRPGSRAGSRSGSNPASPRANNSDLWMHNSSPPAPYVSSPPMRPHSRAQSHGQFSLSSFGHNSYNSSPEHQLTFDGIISPSDRSRHSPNNTFNGDDSFERAINMVPMPRGSDSDPDSDEEEDPTMGLVVDRSTANSMASMMPEDRIEALRKTNQDMARKLVDAEDRLRLQMEAHETDIEQMDNKLEELRSELSATKREEKELRSKETRYIHQIGNLESEIARLQKALETAKSSYQSLQKQYQEQCAESESLRNALRTRDEQYRDANEKISMHGLEIEKWESQRDTWEATHQNLEQQLVVAREAQAQLDVQKQENMLLKETIDRMRFDMDELRVKADGNIATVSGSGSTSNQNTISKSLGAELLRSNSKWLEEESDGEESTTAVDEEGSGGSGTDEDVVQTIITRRKKKVTSRAMKVETHHLEEVKEYSDAYTQYERSEFTSSTTVQTDPEPRRRLASFSAQTEVATTSFSTQTDPIPVPPPIVKVEMEIQTDEIEDSPSGSVTPGEDMASSSSTVVPATPKATTQSTLLGDLPPSYSQVADFDGSDPQTQRDIRVAAETIRKWHEGLHVPLAPVPGGVSAEALEGWSSLKEELGFECLAIDKVIEMSIKTGLPRDAAAAARGEGPAVEGADADEETSDSETNGKGPTTSRRITRKGRFYNIYNTFVYGHPERERNNALSANITQAAVVLGVCAIAASVVTAPYTQPQYQVPGAPTYYDRAAWSEFNRLYPAGEGFGGDGAATVWSFLSRIGGGAARMARGWPT